MINLSNLPIILYLVAIPLISYGTTGGNLALTWLGFGALLIGGGITPGLRLGENDSGRAAANAQSQDKAGNNG